MKIKSLTLRNYKRFTNEQTISFCNEQGQVNDITTSAKKRAVMPKNLRN